MRAVLDPVLLAEMSKDSWCPVHLFMLVFRSSVQYVWSGSGTLTWNGHDFLGVGSLGAVGDVKESSEVRADGTSVTLGGPGQTPWSAMR